MELPPTTLPPIGSDQGTTEPGAGDLASSLLNDLTASPPPAAPPVEAPKPDAPPAEIPPTEPKPTAPKVEPAKPAPKAEVKPSTPPAKPATPPNFDDPKLTAADLRKHLKEMRTNLDRTLAEKETALTQTKSRLADLEKKRFWTDDDQKKFDELTTGKAAIEADLYGRNYAESPEYKQLFVDKMNSQAAEAVEVFSALTAHDAEGNERQGSEQDMMRLYKADNNLDRRRIAKELFGDDFQEALDAVKPMLDTAKAAKDAVKSKRENYQSEITNQSRQIQEQQTQIGQFVQTASEHLRASQPDVFDADENDPQSGELLKKGFSFVDEATSSADKLTVNERAGRIALIRSMAGAFPRLVADKRRLSAENASLMEELKKYRGSDPGAGGSGGSTAPAATGAGTDDLAAEIEALEKK